MLDRTLTRYGTETKQARSGIPITIKTLIDQTWSGDSFRSDSMDRAVGPHAEIFYGEMRQIEPHTEFQHAVCVTHTPKVDWKEVQSIIEDGYRMALPKMMLAPKPAKERTRRAARRQRGSADA